MSFAIKKFVNKYIELYRRVVVFYILTRIRMKYFLMKRNTVNPSQGMENKMNTVIDYLGFEIQNIESLSADDERCIAKDYLKFLPMNNNTLDMISKYLIRKVIHFILSNGENADISLIIESIAINLMEYISGIYYYQSREMYHKRDLVNSKLFELINDVFEENISIL